MLQKIGYNIIAPCTSNEEKCKLNENDWCHAVVRVARNKVHKYIKEATVPYEDEKFTYIAISKKDYGREKARILRKPIVQNGKIILKLCQDGKIVDMIVTKKDKEMYKYAKKKECGDYM